MKYKIPLGIGDWGLGIGDWGLGIKVAAVESNLDQRAVGHTHAEDFGEGLDHRVGDVVGKAPQGKATGHHDEGQHIAHALTGHQHARFIFFIGCHSVSIFSNNLAIFKQLEQHKKGCFGCCQLFRLFDSFTIILLWYKH